MAGEELAAGTVFGSYRVDEVLGRGGMGVVYRAHELALARKVALKVVAPHLLQDDWARLQFLREARFAASLEHPNVVPIYATGEHDGTTFLAMRYVDGHDLHAEVRHGGPLGFRRAVALVAQIAGALDAAHVAGLVHRDVKPANVLVSAAGHAYLTDFGIAQHARRAGKRVKGAKDPLLGTVGYVAPEVIAGDSAEAPADVYALGCLLFFLLTGRTPFEHGDRDVVLEGHRSAQPPLVSQAGTAVPPELDPVLGRALEKDPAQRFASAGELAAAARAAVAAASAETAGPDADGPTITVDLTSRPEPVPLPAALERHVAKPLFGRAGELEHLNGRWRAVAAGRELRCVVLGGEPGVGKTRLLAEACRLAHAEGATVLYGRCHEHSPFPYTPFVEALRSYVAAMSPERLRAGVGPGIAPLARLVPQLAGRVPDEAPAMAADPAGEQLRLFDAIASLIAGAARPSPVVVALDDLQWADQPTLRLLEHLARTAAQAPVLVLGTYRDTEADAGQPLQETLATLRRERILEDIRVGGLDESAIIEVARGASPATPPAALLHALFEQTGGNPYFVEELMRDLGDAAQAGKRPMAELLGEVGVPVSIRDLIGRRLGRLSESTSATVSAASVIGAEFELEVLRLLTATAEETLIDELDEAAAGHVVAELPGSPGRFTFAHALVRETVYAGMSATRRARLHGRAARAIEECHGGRPTDHLPALARHHELAGDAKGALRYHRLAGQATERVHAIDDALDHYSRALEVAAELGLGAEDPAVYEVRHRRSELRQRIGDLRGALEDSEVALSGARAAGDLAREIEALNWRGWLQRPYHFQEAVACHELALQVAERAGDARAQAGTLARLSMVYSNQLRLEEAVVLGDRALAIATAAGDDDDVGEALDAVKLAALQIGDFPVLERATTKLLELHEEAGAAWALYWMDDWVLLERAFIAIAAADWDKALAAVQDAMDTNRRLHNRFARPIFLDALAWIHRSRGDHERALALGNDAVGLAVEIGTAEWLAWTSASLGWTLLEAGDPARAAEHLERGVAAAEAVGARAQMLRCSALLAWAAWDLGDRERALGLAERAEALIAAITAPAGRTFLLGAHAALAVARVLLAAGEPQRAGDLVTPVLLAAREAGWLETLAYASLLDGSRRAADGGGPGARRAIEESLEIARSAGIPWVEGQARAKLSEVAEAHR